MVTMIKIKSKLSDKEQFLFRVKNAMLLYFPHREIRSTLEDLDEMFEAGKENGRSEEEICQDLGTPKDFVQTLLQEDGRDRSVRILRTYIAAVLLLCIALAAVYLYPNLQIRPFLLCIPVILVPACVGYVCGGFCLCRQSWKAAGSLKKYVAYLILSLLIVIEEQVFTIWAHYDPEPLIPYALASYYIACFLVFVSILVCLAVFYETDRGGYRSFPVLILAMGTNSTAISYVRFIQRYDGPGKIWYLCSLPYLVSVAAAIFYSLYIKKRLKKEKEME